MILLLRSLRMYALLLLPMLGAVACARDTLKLKGTVVRVRGNQMPSPDLPPPTYPGYQTTLYFFEPARVSQAVPVGKAGLYREIGTRLVARTKSDEKGLFSVRLAPGRYSVLIGVDSLFYSNITDGEGYINPVTIRKGDKKTLSFRADWDASY